MFRECDLMNLIPDICLKFALLFVNYKSKKTSLSLKKFRVYNLLLLANKREGQGIIIKRLMIIIMIIKQI